MQGVLRRTCSTSVKLPSEAELVTTDIIEMTRDPHWHVQMSPFKRIRYCMSWIIEGPLTWSYISEGLQAQFTSLRGLMTMQYFCYVAATVANMLNQYSVYLSGFHLCLSRLLVSVQFVCVCLFQTSYQSCNYQSSN